MLHSHSVTGLISSGGNYTGGSRLCVSLSNLTGQAAHLLYLLPVGRPKASYQRWFISVVGVTGLMGEKKTRKNPHVDRNLIERDKMFLFKDYIHPCVHVCVGVYRTAVTQCIHICVKSFFDYQHAHPYGLKC